MASVWGAFACEKCGARRRLPSFLMHSIESLRLPPQLYAPTFPLTFRFSEAQSLGPYFRTKERPNDVSANFPVFHDHSGEAYLAEHGQSCVPAGFQASALAKTSPQSPRFLAAP